MFQLATSNVLFWIKKSYDFNSSIAPLTFKKFTRHLYRFLAFLMSICHDYLKLPPQGLNMPITASIHRYYIGISWFIMPNMHKHLTNSKTMIMIAQWYLWHAELYISKCISYSTLSFQISKSLDDTYATTLSKLKSLWYLRLQALLKWVRLLKELHFYVFKSYEHYAARMENVVSDEWVTSYPGFWLGKIDMYILFKPTCFGF